MKKYSISFIFLSLYLTTFSQNSKSVNLYTGYNAYYPPTTSLSLPSQFKNSDKNTRMTMPSIGLTFAHNKSNRSYFSLALSNYAFGKERNISQTTVQNLNRNFQSMIDFTYNWQSRFIRESKFKMGLGIGMSAFLDKNKTYSIENQQNKYISVYTGITPIIQPKLQYWCSEQLYLELSVPLRNVFLGMVYDKNTGTNITSEKWRGRSNLDTDINFPPRFVHIGLGYQLEKNKKTKKHSSRKVAQPKTKKVPKKKEIKEKTSEPAIETEEPKVIKEPKPIKEKKPKKKKKVQDYHEIKLELN